MNDFTFKRAKISGTGAYLPKKPIRSSELDFKLNKPDGWVAAKSGVHIRHFSDNETTSEMGAKAALLAVKQANLCLEDIDCIVSASGVMQQAIPATAALIKEELGLKTAIPCLDINSTCLSFLSAIDLYASVLQSEQYKHVLIVSSEIPSHGINWQDLESSILFGDGAAAIVLSAPCKYESSKIITSKFETHIEGTHYCEIKGGGTLSAPAKRETICHEDHLFSMNGKKVFKMAMQHIPAFVDKVLNEAKLTRQDIKWLIPHQASGSALKLMERKLKFESPKFINKIANYGNQMAASIPTLLHNLCSQYLINRGDIIMLLGSGAGFSIGAVVLEF